MNDQAREVLAKVISTYGPSICHTPRSCELFLRQECGAYPEESRVLTEALRHGTAGELLRYQPGDQPWQAFFGQLRRQLQTVSKMKDEEVNWAIDTWARVLGRHPEVWTAAPDAMRLPMQPLNPRPEVSQTAVVTATTLIVATGGAIGGALGAMLVPAALLVTQAVVDMPIMKETLRHSKAKDVWMMVCLILAIIGGIGALGGGMGAALGWLHGKGDTRPWRGFSVALSATFTSAAIFGYFCGIFGWFIGSFLSGFGSSRACASRGGYY